MATAAPHSDNGEQQKQQSQNDLREEDEERIRAALSHKDEGNAAFAMKKYQQALDSYQKGLDVLKVTATEPQQRKKSGNSQSNSK